MELMITISMVSEDPFNFFNFLRILILKNNIYLE